MSLTTIQTTNTFDFWRQRYNEMVDYLTPGSGSSIFRTLPAAGNAPIADVDGKFTVDWIRFDTGYTVYSQTTHTGTDADVLKLSSLSSDGTAATNMHVGFANNIWTLETARADGGVGYALHINSAHGGAVTFGGDLSVVGNVDLTGSTSVLMKDSTFRISDNADVTKLLAFELSSIATATTRTLTIPNASFTVAGINLGQAFTGAQDFTGATITAVTQTVGDNSTKAATTAFVSTAVANTATPWVTFDGNTGTILDGNAMVTVTRISTGRYNITQITPFANAFYGVFGGVQVSTNNIIFQIEDPSSFTKTASVVRVITVRNDTGTVQDTDEVHVMFRGNY